MLTELDEYLNSNITDDYWYEEALFICEDIIREFTDDDWNKLKDMIPKEDMRWNIRLVECLGDIQNEYAIECIITMLSINNNDLFISCIDSMRDMNIHLHNDDLQIIVCKAKSLLDESTPPVKKVLQSFIEKVEIK